MTNHFVNSSPRTFLLESVGVVEQTSLFLGLLIVDGTLASLACLANFIFIIVIWKGRHVILKRPFYYILVQLVLCTTLKAVTQIALILPSYADPDQVSESFKEATVFLDTFSDFGILFFSTLIAVNRFLVFAIRNGDKILTKQRIVAGSFLCWLLSSSTAAVVVVLGCTRKYDSVSRTYYDICLGDKSKEAAHFITVTTYLVYFLCVFNLGLYIFLIIRIRKQRYKISVTSNPTSKATNPEFFILLQSLVLFALYSLFVLLFSLLPLLTLPRDQFFLITLSGNLLSIAIALSYPLFLLVTTLEARLLIANAFRNLPKTSFPLTKIAKILEVFRMVSRGSIQELP